MYAVESRRLPNESRRIYLHSGAERADPAATAVGTWALGFNSLVRGQGITALSYFQQWARGTSVPASTEILAFDAGPSAAAYLALASFCLGHLDRALIRSETAIGIARELAHPETEAVIYAVVSLARAKLPGPKRTLRSLRRGSCPKEWCKSGDGFRALRRGWPGPQAATAGSLTMGSSLKGAMVSSVM
jgi:hypothetical protein